MESLKMSDVFNLPVYEHDGSVMCQGVIKHSQPHAELCMQAISYTGNDEKLAKHTVHAVNNHDRLVEENAELREMLKRNKKAFLNLIELDLIRDSAKQETKELADSIHKLLNK